MTALEIIADIRNISTSGSNSDDFRIEDQQILFWIDQTRSMLINQALDKKKDINELWVQTISCLDLIQVDNSECCEITTNCKLLRTELQIPEDIIITRITDSTGSILSKSSNFENVYNSYNKYTSNLTKWFYRNGYIYVINNDFLSKINISAIWERPSELTAYTNCNGSTCYTTNSEYPCTMKMASTITDIVLKTKVYPFIQLPRDTTNDNSNTFTPPNTSKL